MEMYGRTPDHGLTVCHKSGVLMVDTCPKKRSGFETFEEKSLNTRNVTNNNFGLNDVSEHFSTNFSVQQEGSSKEDITTFLETAKLDITHPKLKELFYQILQD